MLPSLLSYRINILTNLKNLLQSNDENWLKAIDRAAYMNTWFTIPNINKAVHQICEYLLDATDLEEWVSKYPKLLQHPENKDKTVGLIMAGNIPLVGFHDFLCLFIAGYSMKLKLSSKDTVLWQFILEKIKELGSELNFQIETAEMLKGCDIYIATGSNNSARYFESYFNKYPSIIRKNRTSVAILDGTETSEQLLLLKEDMSAYFGLGCRNVSKIYVPSDYDLGPLIALYDTDEALAQHTKYQNNYDYYYAIYLLNKVKHFTGNNILFLESTEPFAHIATIHYEHYDPKTANDLITNLENDVNLQAIVGNFDNKPSSKCVSLGESQSPHLMDYADGVDTMSFLENLIQ